MILDMPSAIAQKYYDNHRNRQMQRIARAKAESKYLRRRKDKGKIIASLLKSGHNYSDTRKVNKCSPCNGVINLDS